MKYSEIYSKSYDENYVQLEAFCKKYFVDAKADSLAFTNTLNELRTLIYSNRAKIFSVTYEKEIEKLVFLFDERYSFYEKNEIDLVLEKKIKKEFNENCHFPKEYHFEKFIEELGKFDASKEISRLLSINNTLFDFIYQLEEFDKFEIKDYRGNLESQPIFKKYRQILYPDPIYQNIIELNEKEIKIFKEDGLDIFNFINKLNKHEETPSYYSYLFNFLKTKGKIVTENKDCSLYRKYVTDLKKITFSRITTYDEKHSDKKNEMDCIFEASLIEFYKQNEQK